MVLGIYGSGGLGREVLELARQIQAVSNKWKQIVFIDNFSTEQSKNNTSILSFSMFNDAFRADNAEISIAVGEPMFRMNLSKEVLSAGYTLAALIHPSVKIPESTVVKSGATVCSNAFISCNVVLGANTHVQPHVQISHDCVVGDHAVITPSANLAGNVTVGEGSYIGMGAIVKERVSIGSWAIIGMGSLVYHDVADEVVAIGNPARVIKKNIERRVFK